VAGAIRLQIVPRSSFKSVPWKNGGGMTHEAMRVPAQGDDFIWRVSVAQIEASGPFSDFAAYHRTMVLLEGAGLELDFGGGSQRRLSRVGECVQFDGGLPPHCRLLDGPCSDLNLMVAKTRLMAARVEQLQDGREVSASHGQSALIFGIDAPLELNPGSAREPRLLPPWDLAVLTDGVIRLSPCSPPAPATVFLATIGN
jgi:environmental stress-induced protein Ves